MTKDPHNHGGQMALALERLANDPLALIDDHLKDLPANPVFYLYGAGNVGRKMARGLLAQGVNVAGFLDNNLELVGKVVEDIPVLSFAGLRVTADAVCVICIWRYNHDPAQSATHAEVLGFRHVIHFAALAAGRQVRGVLPNYAVDHPGKLFGSDIATRVARLEQFFSDQASRNVMWSVLAFHALPDPSMAPGVQTAHFPSTPLWS